MEAPPINQEQMDQLLEWIDGLPFSRPKKNLSRDFSDGVLVAEILKNYHPKLVQLHNYPSASALNAKFSNWKTLNDKVLRKIRLQIHPSDIQNIIMVAPGYIERVLFMIYAHLRRQEQERPVSGQNSIREIKNMADSRQNYQIATQLAEKEDTIIELRSTIEMLQAKMRRMQELNRLKDAKIQSLIRKLQQGIN